jgi:transcriptional regulator with XRE-family HTH domain
MAVQSAVEARFRDRVKNQRERRKWSQADLSKMLSGKGIKGIYPTTIAKIESGERAVRIDEAAALADLFEVSLDALLGRGASAPRNELAYVLRLLRDTAGESSHQVGAAMEKIREQLEELPEEFDGGDALRRIGRDAWSTHLSAALAALIRLETWSEKLLRREQGRPDLAEEATMGLEEREDEAQS